MKEVLLILLAMAVFSEHVSLLSGLGILTALVASAWYRRLVAATSNAVVRSRSSDENLFVTPEGREEGEEDEEEEGWEGLMDGSLEKDPLDQARTVELAPLLSAPLQIGVQR